MAGAWPTDTHEAKLIHSHPVFPERQDCEDKASEEEESQCMSEPTFG